MVESFGKDRLVDDLAADDFQALRAKLAKLYGVHKLGKEVQLTRTLFKYGVDAGLIDKPVRFGPTFKKPANRIMRHTGRRMASACSRRHRLRTIHRRGRSTAQGDDPARHQLRIWQSRLRHAAHECLGFESRLGELSPAEDSY